MKYRIGDVVAVKDGTHAGQSGRVIQVMKDTLTVLDEHSRAFTVNEKHVEKKEGDK